MLVFRHAERQATVGAIWQECLEAGRLTSLLACSRLEGALADRWAEAAGGADGLEAGHLTRLALTRAAAMRYLEMRPGPQWPELVAEAAALLPAPETRVHYHEPEGFRFYGLRPELYREPALAWLREHPGVPALVLGLRTIGSTLGAVVAAVLGARWLSLRPRGEAQRRRPAVTADLAARLRRWQGAVLIVDEGPGLSGSSLGGTVQWLRTLGIRATRISILPGWRAEGAVLSNPYAAQHWNRWRLYTPAAEAAPERDARYIGHGHWRAALKRHRRAAVWAQHERPKYLSHDGARIWKFCGLGDHGQQARERARALARGGWSPPVCREHDAPAGWICFARQRCARTRPTRASAEAAGRYLAWVESNFLLRAGCPPTAALQTMLRDNCEELLGRRCELTPAVGAWVALDARMRPEEWGLGAEGPIKFDSSDHADDPFYPGAADTAWDLAGLEVEFGAAWGGAARAAYLRASGQSRRVVEARVVWHRAAYLAARAAYCQLAARQSAGWERDAFETLAARYTKRLARSI